jgi:hypothetical protein
MPSNIYQYDDKLTSIASIVSHMARGRWRPVRCGRVRYDGAEEDAIGNARMSLTDSARPAPAHWQPDPPGLSTVHSTPRVTHRPAPTGKLVYPPPPPHHHPLLPPEAYCR